MLSTIKDNLMEVTINGRILHFASCRHSRIADIPNLRLMPTSLGSEKHNKVFYFSVKPGNL
jgi:hypothetical protein